MQPAPGNATPIAILIADDDHRRPPHGPEALEEAGAGQIDLRLMENGEELMDYSIGGARYADAARSPAPA